MTRLEPAGEPSMEEILASIRRIIAEDPPGSRPAEAVSASLAAAPRDEDSARVPQSAPEFDAEAIADQDFTGFGTRAATARQPDPSPAVQPPFGQPSFGQTSFGLPSFAARDQGPVAPAAARPAPFDIDAQLADVLGSTRAPSPAPSAPPRVEPAVSAPSTSVSVQAAIDSLIAPREEPAPRAAQRPGFTVSRDGYIPESPAAAPPAAKTPAPVADPFEFTLGPSPFARTQSPTPAADSVPMSGAARDLGAIIPAQHRLGDAPASGAPVAAAPPFATLAIEPAQAAGRPAPQPDFGRLSLSPDDTAQSSSAVALANTPQAKPQALTDIQDPAPATRVAADSSATSAIPSKAAAAPTDATQPAPAPASAEAAIAVLERIANPKAEAPEPNATAVAADETAVASTPVEEALRVSAATPAHVAAAPVAAATAAAADVAATADPAVAETSTASQKSETNTGTAAMPAAAVAVPAASSAQMPDASGATAEIIIDDDKAESETAPPAATSASRSHATPSDAAVPHGAASFTADLSRSTSSAPAVSALALRDAHIIETPDSEHAAHDLAPPRTMEDTVAELLRPMLKNWLAENMPKIVERALRKELDDRNRSEHKTAAE